MAVIDSPTVNGMLTWVREFMDRQKMNYTFHMQYSTLTHTWSAQVNAETIDGNRGWNCSSGHHEDPHTTLQALAQRLHEGHADEGPVAVRPTQEDPPWVQEADVVLPTPGHREDGSYVVPQSMTNGRTDDE